LIIPEGLFHDESLNVCFHRRAEDISGTKVSLLLCSLVCAEVVAMCAVMHLYLTCAGNGKTLRRCLMCLDLSHCYKSFRLLFAALPQKVLFSRLCLFSFGGLLCALFYLFCACFEGHEEHHKLTALQGGLLIQGGYLGTGLCELHHYLASEILMGHFSSLEAESYSYLVTLAEEFDGTVCHSVEVVLVDTAGKVNLLDNDSLLLLHLFLFSLMLLITVLTVIHGAAYGRSSLRRDTNKVYALFVRIFLCLFQALDTQLIAVLIEKTNLFCTDIVIDKKLLCAYSTTPPKNLVKQKSAEILRTKLPLFRGKFLYQTDARSCGTVRTEYVLLLFAQLVYHALACLSSGF